MRRAVERTEVPGTGGRMNDRGIPRRMPVRSRSCARLDRESRTWHEDWPGPRVPSESRADRRLLAAGPTLTRYRKATRRGKKRLAWIRAVFYGSPSVEPPAAETVAGRVISPRPRRTCWGGSDDPAAASDEDVLRAGRALPAEERRRLLCAIGHRDRR
jgi:hypothetical protein